MCLLVLLPVLCISVVTASHRHHDEKHAFRYSVRRPRIVEMPTQSFGRVKEDELPANEGAVGLHASKHHIGFQRALENAENKVRQEEQIREDKKKTKHHLGFQRALENAEKKVREEERAHEAEQKKMDTSNHHLGYQHAMKNAELKVLEEEQIHAKEAKAHEVAKLKEAQKAKKAKEAKKVKEAQQKKREMEAVKRTSEEELRAKELQEANAEAERAELSNARRLISKRNPWNPIDAMKKGFEDAAEVGKKAVEGVKKAAQSAYDTAGKPLMNPINTMRAELCIRRKPLLTHKPCMKFMIKQCTKQSTGQGYCKKFFHMVLDACFRAQEQGEDPEGYCELAETMGSKRDVDEDGVPDITDKFPNDRDEWADMDNDGIGDNKDPDRDGDGLPNDKDEFPEDPTRPEQTNDMDGDGIPDDKDNDMDGDGYNNTDDSHPRDPLLPGMPGPAPAPASAVEPEAPAPAPPAAAPAASGPGSKEIRGLPEQGYGEYHRGKLVEYADGDDYSGDWQGEWPLKDETHAESVFKACQNHPKSTWCIRFAARHASGALRT